jgi:hypothetical protein
MAIINTNGSFGSSDTVTHTTLNTVADGATFNDPVDEETLELITTGSNSGKLRVKAGGITFSKLTDVNDDDTMSNASATTLATSESIKAYVDSSTGLIQRKRVTSGTASSTTEIMNFDDTAPLTTEGTEILSTTFTPTSTSNEIIVDFDGLLYNSNPGGGCMLALFEGNTCVGARWWIQATSGGPPTRASFSFTPSSTSQATYSLRFGVFSGQTGYINSVATATSGYTLGGNMKINMEIQEVQASQ